MHTFYEASSVIRPDKAIGWHVYPDGSWVQLVVQPGFATFLADAYNALGKKARALKGPPSPEDLDFSLETASSREYWGR